jgi:hypothetical protein
VHASVCVCHLRPEARINSLLIVSAEGPDAVPPHTLRCINWLRAAAAPGAFPLLFSGY